MDALNALFGGKGLSRKGPLAFWKRPTSRREGRSASNLVLDIDLTHVIKYIIIYIYALVFGVSLPPPQGKEPCTNSKKTSSGRGPCLYICSHAVWHDRMRLLVRPSLEVTIALWNKFSFEELSPFHQKRCTRKAHAL